jgi:hypothetical protein
MRCRASRSRGQIGRQHEGRAGARFTFPLALFAIADEVIE